jgi:VWFA-related protein
LALPVPGQTPAASGAPATGSTPLIQVSTHLVQINVVVHGKKNEPLTDLTKDDFEIFDNGAKQRVATLSLEASAPPPSKSAFVPLPVNTFTNRAELRPKEARAVTVILLDGLNTKFEDQAYARQQLVKFLKELEPSDRVGLYTLGTNLKILYEFTNDAGPLLQRLNKSASHIGGELEASMPEDSDTGNDDLDQMINGSNQKIADYQTINRVETTLAAIEAIANHVSRIPGRKNLIWLSGGFPFSIGLDDFTLDMGREQRTFTEELERAARAVNAANMAIYPVDARGLTNPDANFSATSRGNSNIKAPVGPSRGLVNLQNTQATMQIIADRTGGRAYMNSNDLKSAIRNAVDDSKVSYVVGYYPTHNTWDGKWHPLKISCLRKGIEVRYRQGYFAFQDQPQDAHARDTAIKETIWDPLDESSVGLTVRLGPNIPKEGLLRVVLLVAMKDLQFQLENDKFEGKVDVVFVKQAAADQAPTVVVDSIGMHLTKAQYDGYVKDGWLRIKDMPLAEAAYKLKVMVRDGVTGNVGSVNMRTDKLKPIPPIAAVPAGK